MVYPSPAPRALGRLVITIAGLGACFSVEANTDVEEASTGESQEAINLFEDRFGEDEDLLTEFLVISHPVFNVDAPEFQELVEGIVADLRALRLRETFDVLGTSVEGSQRFIAATTSHFDLGLPRTESPFVAPIAAGGDITFVLIELEPEFDDALDGIGIFNDVTDEAAAAHPEFAIAVGGVVTLSDQLGNILDDDFAKASLISLPLTAIVLMFAFGTMSAVFMPLLVGFAVVGIAVGVMNLISRGGVPLDESFAQVILLVGLAAAIDYGIYMIGRYRHERRDGYPETAAVLGASGTVGKALLISAMTTLLALSGLFFLGSATFTSLALAAIVSIIVALLMALTLMPAWQALVGDGLGRWPIPFTRGGFAAAEGGGIVAGGIDRMLSRPALYAPLAIAALIVVALPLFSINLGQNGIRAFTDDAEGKAPLLALEESFSLGLVQPALVLVDAGAGGNVFGDDVQRGVQRLNESVAAETSSPENPDGVFGSLVRTRTNDAADTLLFEIPINADSSDAIAIETVKRLRSTIVPEAMEASPAEALVTGTTAFSIDFVDKMNSRLPITIGFVIGTSFLVLVVMFRSLLLPLVAILLNLLADGAAFGIMKLTFQDGHVLEGILNYEATGIIEAWVPMFVFAIMFGISFDDLTFAIGRVRENHERGEDIDTAVRGGLKSVAMTILAADLILAGVVGIFAFMRLLPMQQLGIAMVVAVVLGALLVIVIVMPALLRAIGDRLWYFPAQLAWIPMVSSDDAALRALYQAGPGVDIRRAERERLQAAATEPMLDACSQCGGERIDSLFCTSCGVLNADPEAGIRQVGRGRLLAVGLVDAILLIDTLGIAWAIWTTFSARRSQTPGCQLLGVYVFDETGQPATPRRVWLRGGYEALVAVGLGLVTAGVMTLADYFWVYRYHNRQTLHDLAAETIIVQTPRA